MIPPGATNNEHHASRRYGGRRPGGAAKDVSFRATGLILGDAVLGAVSEKPDVTQAIAFRQWK